MGVVTEGALYAFDSVSEDERPYVIKIVVQTGPEIRKLLGPTAPSAFIERICGCISILCLQSFHQRGDELTNRSLAAEHMIQCMLERAADHGYISHYGQTRSIYKVIQELILTIEVELQVQFMEEQQARNQNTEIDPCAEPDPFPVLFSNDKHRNSEEGGTYGSD